MKEFKGLYVHVPFCRSKCPYCDFYSLPSLKGAKGYLKLILEELNLLKPDFCQFPTVYFGGGTPSVMDGNFFEAILSKVGQFSEVTVELNPEDATAEKLRTLREIGVNRVSLGLQSLSQKHLKTLGRCQTLEENLKALETALKFFSNVSVDLIYGVPGQKPQEFIKELQKLLEFPVKHVSLYSLTVYEETPLGRAVRGGKVELPDEGTVEEIYLQAVALLSSAGFKHYEISNFALPGFESKHNLLYWKVENYLGVGPSAASLAGNLYWKNAPSLKNYGELLSKGRRPSTEEVEMTDWELLELKVAMGMRLTEGVELPENLLNRLTESEKINFLIEEGLIELNENRIRLKERGLLLENPVVAEVVGALREAR